MARPEGEYVEYDLDNEDEDWLAQFNEGQERLPPEKCARQPACGTMTPSCGHHGRGN
jgi:Enhancer of polycomb-like